MVSSAPVILFMQGAALGFWASASPGPFQAYLLAQSVREGPARALPLAAVPLASDPPVVAIVLAVLAHVPAGFLRVLQVCGGIFVLWLGASALRAALRPAAEAAGGADGREPPRGFLRAAVVNFTNPNVWIFWSVVGGPIVAEAWRASPARAAEFLAGMYLLLLAVNALLVAVFGAAGRLGPRTSRALAGLSSGALAAFGLWQVGRGIWG